MAESISIPLTHIQNMLDEIVPSWIYNRLHELKSMLIQIQQSQNYLLLQDLPRDAIVDLKNLINDIRQFAYKIDDQLDTISINIESCGRWINSDIPNVIKTLGIAYHKSKFLHNIRSLIDLAQKSKLFERRMFGIKDTNELQRRSSHLHHDYNNFSNDFEERIFVNSKSRKLVDNIINNISNKNSYKTITEINLSTHYVYVKAIYDIVSTQKYFQYVAWVNVKYGSTRITIYRDILKQLLVNDEKNDIVGLMAMNEDGLRKELMEVLTCNKCFVLVTFDQSTYDENLLYEFNIPMKSKLLVAHENELNWDVILSSYGWKVLESITIENQHFETEDVAILVLKEIGQKLLMKSKGKVRQIIRLGGLLRENVSINHWRMVEKSLSYPNGVYDNWMVMALCYDHLPIYLKACFLYFGLFWKDIDIRTEILYQMWMAEGIVSTMDMAEEYLAMLARMLLIDVQESEFSTSRRFVLCHIDNFIKEFCLHPSPNFFYHYRVEWIEKALRGSESYFGHCLGLSIKFDNSSKYLNQNDIGVKIMKTIRLASKELRSLLIQKENGIPRIKISFPSEIYKNTKMLRVLKIENFEILDGKLPKEIRTLIHLRFLSLEGSTFEELPETLGNFRFMQTLDLRVAEIIPRGIVVPNVLRKLKELRHLYLPTCHRVEKENDKLFLNGLNKLETIVNFDIEKVELTSLEWKSLQHIDARVHGNKSVCDVIDYINNSGNKLKETFLHISFSGFSYEESDVPIEDVFNCSKLNHFMVNWGRCNINEFKVPSPFSSNLIELCLIRCQISEDPMPILGNFLQLRKLIIGKKTFTGTYMTFGQDTFPALRHLEIKNLMFLEDLDIYNGSMRNLSYLEIIYCLKMKMIPSGLTLLRSLTKLKLGMPKMFNDRLRKQDENEGEDFKIVKHVSFIFLEDL